jgi:tripartite-type tricarboxylate transporter receptor subunit TctC
MSGTRRSFVQSLAALCGSIPTLSAAQAGAQAYPSRRITVIASYPPGGGTDLLARLVATKLAERWNVPTVVENRVGGNGVVGARAAASATPDGYTLYVGSSNLVIMLASLYSNLSVSALRDYEPISPIANQHSVLVVHPSVPASTLGEFIALVKSRPGVFNFASPGVGSYDHLAMLMFQARNRTDATHVPYKGSGEAVAAVLGGGDVSVMFGSIGTVTPLVRSGRLRALAITAPARSPALPEVPTTAEAGLPDFVIFSWNGVFAPAGTPRDIVAKIGREVETILKLPDVSERLSSLGFVAAGSGPEQFAAQIQSELDGWARTLKSLGIDQQKL